MRILPYLILFCLITGKIFPQNCKIDNPLMIDKANINETFITSKIKEVKKVFKPEEIKIIEKQIIECNNSIDNSIAKLKTSIMNFSFDKQELLKMKDLRKIQEQIEEKQKSRGKIKEQIQSDLSTINLKGLYLCVLKDLNPMSHSPAELADKSKSIIAPSAIEFINGTFISSVTDLYKSNKQESLTTYIKGIISGELGVDKVAFSKRANGQTQFIYIAKISVAPLKKAIKTKELVYGESKNNTLVLNLLNEDDYKNKLKSFGISESDIVDVDNQINFYKELIKEENELTKKQEQNILSNGNANLEKIDNEISDLESQFNNSGKKIKSLIEDKTTIKYSKEKHEECMNDALKFFDNKIQSIYQQIVDLKEQELIGMYDRNVSNEDSPEKDIAKTAMNLCDQIKKNYSKLEQFLKIQELLNNEFTNNQQGQEKTTYREIDKIWVYPVPGDDSNYKLTVIAKFKISKINEVIENQEKALNKKKADEEAKAKIKADEEAKKKSEVKAKADEAKRLAEEKKIAEEKRKLEEKEKADEIKRKKDEDIKAKADAKIKTKQDAIARADSIAAVQAEMEANKNAKNNNIGNDSKRVLKSFEYSVPKEGWTKEYKEIIYNLFKSSFFTSSSSNYFTSEEIDQIVSCLINKFTSKYIPSQLSNFAEYEFKTIIMNIAADCEKALDFPFTTINTPLSDKSTSDKLIGKWRDENSYFSFFDDGTQITNWDNGEKATGTWKLDKGLLILANKNSNGKSFTASYFIIELTDTYLKYQAAQKNGVTYNAKKVK